MGYCTRFSLDVLEGAKSIKEILPSIKSICEEFDYIFDGGGESWDAYKWYSHEKDMLEISSIYKDYVFTLKGEGEEAGDIWVKHFKDGKMQSCYAKITFEEYDENKLV